MRPGCRSGRRPRGPGRRSGRRSRWRSPGTPLGGRRAGSSRDRRGARSPRSARRGRRAGRAGPPATDRLAQLGRDRDGRPASRSAGPASATIGSSRSAIGRRVVESATPGRALTSVASRTRASGRRRATTMWSAPVASASSLTIAPRIASGDTERDRLDRIRANDSASSRRPTSRVGDRLAMADRREPDDEDEADDRPVDRVGTVRGKTEDGDQAEDEEGDRRRSTRRVSSDVPVSRRVAAAVWRVHSRQG